MKLKTEVEFSLKGPVVSDRVRNLYNVETILKKQYNLDRPCHLKLVCSAQVVRTDKKNQGEENLLDLIGETTHFTDLASLDFIVADKVTTVADIRSYLNEKYGRTFNFEPYENTENKPAVLDYVHEQECTGLRDSKTGQPTHYTLHTVQWHYLDNKDIVVKKDLTQIWPRKTGKVPIAIQKFFHVIHVR